jgi:hypothetical protein
VARISEYNSKTHCAVAKRLASKGFTDSEISEIMGISERTLNNWKEKHAEFMQSLKDGKEEPDNQVERSLFERATGYSYASEKIVTVAMGQGMGSEVERVPIIEHCPPDVTACIFWLKNRRSDRWRDRQEITGVEGGPLEIVIKYADSP